MPEHPNAQLLRKIYARDDETFQRMMAPEYVCHTPGRSQVAGDFKGWEHRTRHGAQIGELTNKTFRVQPLGEFLVDDEWGMVPVQISAERDGKRLDMQAFGIWRFRDGKIAEHWEMNFDQATFDEFFK
ncbi:nuclear transport factor 2 family protein [Bradyrhizobium sp. AUGA SZCCT0042]|uniref:nuclear transport factor 2 family protein n=1 Tax=Bradyrhizobium sp. AUGA SZCCT0042 TaxID=2807651 RepID=UPI001BA7BA90|nr:nuclear transport factor 2 family protein [Bradyrhizobium sp. AUGA SZCCT0042]MBR1297368.1 nuclear transport factor 2 family protein [Bradyrhizobium sp. AUGA SZCCT0042]